MAVVLPSFELGIWFKLTSDSGDLSTVISIICLGKVDSLLSDESFFANPDFCVEVSLFSFFQPPPPPPSSQSALGYMNSSEVIFCQSRAGDKFSDGHFLLSPFNL